MSSSELPIAFVHASDIVPATIALSISGIIVVLLRFWVRVSHKMGVRMDDWLILAALVFVVAMAVVSLYGVSRQAVGYPSEELSPQEQLTSLTPEQRLVELTYWLSSVLMLPATGSVKLSTLYLYRRIFPVETMPAFNILSNLSVVVCALWTIAFFFSRVFGCGIHLQCSWASFAEISTCCTDKFLNQDVLMISDLITDVLIWLLPIPVVRVFEHEVWGLNISTHRKLGVVAIFLLAACSLAAAVVRLLIQLAIHKKGFTARTNVNRQCWYTSSSSYKQLTRISDIIDELVLAVHRGCHRPDRMLLADDASVLQVDIHFERL
ncbi:uncharacterized protein CC84DRAFT_1245417 [Paraphaeosphaeria sporulosa]|uniref:Rhodopsin domain-containing protein n=1 Tax=Paraphaeosphaeria sporulosa TaxID=1460663 RepID=A0A177CFW7_9PLEO|nr:uncharacterized protein CC84DRAFT_1245417 [Paraphaeosphaeria sporulosa]OAG06216.1 hypothetical protein CC84DRAFT_1245417 [Paraphaeosphaeria sporulosa]